MTDDSVQAWVNQRTRFGVFVRAEVCGVADAAGPDYPDWNGRPTPPTMVLTDERGRRLALNGTPCGFDGVGPRAAAQILHTEGLLPAQDALAVVTGNRTLSLRLTPQVHDDDLLPDAVALDPATLALWSSHHRWRGVLQEIDTRLPADPHYPALVIVLERMDAAGVDARGSLADVTGPAGGLLPEFHAGRALHNRLVAASESAGTSTPLTDPRSRSPAPTESVVPARPQARPGPRL